MKNLVMSVIFLVITGVMIGCATLYGPEEWLGFSLPKEKDVKFKKSFNSRNAYLTRFVWEGQAIDNWTEVLEVFNAWRGNYPSAIEDLYKLSIDTRNKKCPDSIFNVINQDPNSILYEIKTINCPPNPDEHSITKLLYGRDNFFELIYTNKTKDLSKETREEWVRILSEAAIKTGRPELGADFRPVL